MKKKSGKREALEPTGHRRARKVAGRTVNIGRTFTEQAAAFTVVDAIREASEKERTVFVKIGGQLYEVPQDRKNDAAAWLTDLRSRFLSIKQHEGRGGYPFTLELSYGSTGVLMDLDRMDFFSPEVSEELGHFAEDQQAAENLAGYIHRTAESYLGIDIDAGDILDAWRSQGTTDEPDEEEEEDEE